MIANQCFTKEWVDKKKQELGSVDPALLEKSIHALALLCHFVNWWQYSWPCGQGPFRNMEGRPLTSSTTWITAGRKGRVWQGTGGCLDIQKAAGYIVL